MPTHFTVTILPDQKSASQSEKIKRAAVLLVVTLGQPTKNRDGVVGMLDETHASMKKALEKEICERRWSGT